MARLTSSRVDDVIERLVRGGTVIARSDGSEHSVFPTAVSIAEGEALRELVRREEATRTIETGFGYGVSALFVCDGLLANGSEGARHVVIDPQQSTRFKDVGSQLLEEAGVAGIVERHDAPSEVVLPRFLDEQRRFDLAFVDGDHRFDGVFIDLFYLGRLVRPGGCIFLDDYQLPGIARATSFWVANVGWTLEEVSMPDPHHQWAVVRTPRQPDTRAFHHFVEF